MGCDIHAYAEVRTDSEWRYADEVGFHRSYGLFGFLADVRNYSHAPVIAEPRSLPNDTSAEVLAEYDEWQADAHNTSWLLLAELVDYDYDQVFWDRRVTKQTAPNVWDGAALAEEGEGRHLPLREFLGEHYFKQLDGLAKLGDPTDVRIVFWFDN